MSYFGHFLFHQTSPSGHEHFSGSIPCVALCHADISCGGQHLSLFAGHRWSPFVQLHDQPEDWPDGWHWLWSCLWYCHTGVCVLKCLSLCLCVCFFIEKTKQTKTCLVWGVLFLLVFFILFFLCWSCFSFLILVFIYEWDGEPPHSKMCSIFWGCACACVYHWHSMKWTDTWICQHTVYFRFIPSTHSHTHTHTHTLIPFEDLELTGLKVDIVVFSWRKRFRCVCFCLRPLCFMCFCLGPLCFTPLQIFRLVAVSSSARVDGDSPDSSNCEHWLATEGEGHVGEHHGSCVACTQAEPWAAAGHYGCLRQGGVCWLDGETVLHAPG